MLRIFFITGSITYVRMGTLIIQRAFRMVESFASETSKLITGVFDLHLVTLLVLCSSEWLFTKFIKKHGTSGENRTPF